MSMRLIDQLKFYLLEPLRVVRLRNGLLIKKTFLIPINIFVARDYILGLKKKFLD